MEGGGGGSLVPGSLGQGEGFLKIQFGREARGRHGPRGGGPGAGAAVGRGGLRGAGGGGRGRGRARGGRGGGEGDARAGGVEGPELDPLGPGAAAKDGGAARRGGVGGGRRGRGRGRGRAGRAGGGKSLSPGKIWSRLFSGVGSAVDDLYFFCEVDCAHERVACAAEYLRVAAEDFRELERRLEEQRAFEPGGAWAVAGGRSGGGAQRPGGMAWKVRNTTPSSKHAAVLTSLAEQQDSPPRRGDDEATVGGGPGRRPAATGALQPRSNALDLSPGIERLWPLSVTPPKSQSPRGTSAVENLVVEELGSAGAPRTPGLSPDKAPPSAALDAWKVKRNWTEILRSSPRHLQEKLMSPERQHRLSPADLKRRAEARQARASALRAQRSTLLAQRLAKAEETREAVRAAGARGRERLAQGLEEKLSRGRENREAHLYNIASRAKESNQKVEAVIETNFLEDQARREALKQRMEEAESRKQELLAAVVKRQKEAEAAVEEAQERKSRLEAERKKRLSEKQRRKEEVQAKKRLERQVAQEQLQQASEQQRAAAEEHLKQQAKESESRKLRLAMSLKDAQRRRAGHLEQIKDRAAVGDRDRRESFGTPSSPGVTPASPCLNRGSESPKCFRSLSLDDGLLKGLQKKAKKFRQRISAGKEYIENKEVAESLKGPGMAQMRTRMVKAMKDLQKLSRRNNMGMLRRSLVEFVHHFASANAADCHLARQSGLLKIVGGWASSSKVPDSVRHAALQLTINAIEGVPESRAFVLCSKILLELVPALTAELNSEEGDEQHDSSEGKSESSKGPSVTSNVGPPLGLMLQVSALALSSGLEAYRQITIDTIGFMICSGGVHIVSEHIALYNTTAPDAPFPRRIVQCLALLEAVTSPPSNGSPVNSGRHELSSITECLMTSLEDTSMVGLPSLLCAALLRASSTSSSGAIQPQHLPPNFVPVAAAVMRILSNCAMHDLPTTQRIMSAPDLRVEIYHALSFLISFCTDQWAAGNNRIKQLLNEVLLVCGYFVVLHPQNQGVLRWGKSPTILKKLCHLPFPYFCDPDLQEILLPTILAACYKNQNNRMVVEQDFSLKMLRRFLRNVEVKGCDSPQKKAVKVGGTQSASRFSLGKRFPLSQTNEVLKWLDED